MGDSAHGDCRDPDLCPRFAASRRNFLSPNLIECFCGVLSRLFHLQESDVFRYVGVVPIRSRRVPLQGGHQQTPENCCSDRQHPRPTDVPLSSTVRLPNRNIFPQRHGSGFTAAPWCSNVQYSRCPKTLPWCDDMTEVINRHSATGLDRFADGDEIEPSYDSDI